MAGWLGVCLGLALWLLPSLAGAQAIPGDADANGGIGRGDVAAIVDTILGTRPAPGHPDCTGDGLVNVLDVVCVQKRIAETAPTVTGFQPSSAKPGMLVTVQGTQFAAAGASPAVTLVRQGGGTIAAPVTLFGPASLTFIVPPGAATGPLTVTVPDRPGATSAAALTILPSSGFSLSASPASISVMRGQPAAVAVTLESGDGFAQLAELSVSGLPAGVTASFDPPRIGAGQSSILTLRAAPNAPVAAALLSLSAAATVDGAVLSDAVDVQLAVEPVTTSFLGRIVVAEPLQRPLAGATVALLGVDGDGNPTGCTATAITDAAGNFRFTGLPAQCAGGQLIRFDGTTATSPPGLYAAVDKFMVLEAGQANAPMGFVHLPAIGGSEVAMVIQNHPVDQSFTFQSIPALSVTIPAGTVFTLPDGTQPNPFPLLAVEVAIDRLPGPMPPDASEIVPFIVAFQPARAEASKPVAVFFPNALRTPPGTPVTLITLDPTRGIMVNYGTGVISADGRQVVPDFDPARPGHRYGLVHLGWHGPVQPPPPAVSPAPPDSGACPVGAKPVDPASGLEVMRATDLALAGGRGGGLSLERTYRTLSTDAGPFGLGTSHNYDLRLDNTAPETAAVVNLILPDGNRLPFTRNASGTLTNATVPSLSGAVLTPGGDGSAQIRFKSGTVLRFQPANITIGSVLESITDPFGNRTALTRDPSNLRRISEIADPAGRKLRLTYDTGGRITSVTDPIGRTVLYTYNGAGLLATVTDPEGGITRYAYDGANRLSQVTDARGVVIARNTYDANGRVIEQIQADGGRWTFEYVLSNALMPSSPVQETTVTDPLGRRTVYRFNPQGYLLDVTDPLGQTRVFEREPGTNRLLALRGTAECGVCDAPADGDETYTYDDRGNLLTRTDALDRTFTYAYEPVFNRPASITNPLGHTRELTYGPGGLLLTSTDENDHTIAFTYNAFGQPEEITDPAGKVSRIEYDGFGNPVRITDPQGNVTLQRFDAVSRLVERVDPLGRGTLYTYDDLDRITSVTDPLGRTTGFTYDTVGNLLEVTDARGNATVFTYDAMNRVLTRTDSRGHISRWTYDVQGNVTRFEDRRGRVSLFTYDDLDRLVREEHPDAIVDRLYDPRSRLLRVEDSAGGVFTYEYDAVGSLLRTLSPVGVVEYVRDDLGRIERRQVAGQPALDLQYDPAGNLLSASMPQASVTFTYDERDLPTRQTRSNGVVTDYGFDDLGRLLSLTDARGAQTINTQTYAYDAVGSRTSYTSGFAEPFATQPTVNVIDPDSDRLLQRGAVTYTYDEDGNRLTETGPEGTASYSWDTRGRLTSITAPGGTTTFRYDWAGNLIEKTTAGPSGDRSETYVLDEITNVAYQRDSDGPRFSVLSGPGIDQHYAVVEEDGGVEFGLMDGLNSTVATVDGAGAVAGRFSYEPYGETAVSGNTVFPFRFTGRTPAVGDLYYYRARFYDPVAGRFLSKDPIGLAGGSTNLYAYAKNSPAVYVDPDGLRGVQQRIPRASRSPYPLATPTQRNLEILASPWGNPAVRRILRDQDAKRELAREITERLHENLGVKAHYLSEWERFVHDALILQEMIKNAENRARNPVCDKYNPRGDKAILVAPDYFERIDKMSIEEQLGIR
jgi:RHS repeat-associated protein